jgi:hypothetical protein
MRAIVYTAMFGGYDVLKQPPQQNEPCEFICFTDSEMPSRVGAWQVVHIKPDPNLHPRIQAKRFKLLSHRIFPRGRLAARYAPFSIRRRANLSIWIDASFQIKSSTFVKDMRGKLGKADWAMFVHPDRDCIYEEALDSIRWRKYEHLPILPQVESYRPFVPPHSGLYACGLIARREPSSRGLNDVHEAWWDENIKWTYQDQLSLPFVIRRAGGCVPVGIQENLWNNDWFEVMVHLADT